MIALSILVWIFGSLIAIHTPEVLTVGGLVVIMDVVNKLGKSGRYIVKAFFSINRAEVALMRIARIMNIPSARGAKIKRIQTLHNQGTATAGQAFSDVHKLGAGTWFLFRAASSP